MLEMIAQQFLNEYTPVYKLVCQKQTISEQ